MNQLKIKEQIDKNNKIIENLLTPNVFTLNNSMFKLLEENKKLQEQCKHEYEDGYCIWCYKSKGEE